MPLITKLWVFSVLLEPLLLFTIADRTQVGIGLNLGRILQFIVITLFLFQFLSGRSFFFSRYVSYLIRPYVLFLLYALIISIISFIFGGGYQNGQSTGEQSLLTSLFHGDQTRPIIEAIIVVYQLFYFIILAPIFLKTDREIRYFFKWAFVFVSMHFILGWIDFILEAFLGMAFLPRHLSDMVYVGLRFHGIAGEPRDAFIYMLSLFFLMAIKSYYLHNKVTISRWMVVLIASSALATVSMSGLLGILLGAVLLILNELRQPQMKRFFYVLVFVFGVSSIFYLWVVSNYRLNLYLASYSELIFNLIDDPYQPLPQVILYSYNNVYPLIKLFNDLKQWNIWPLFFGYGLGSSGIANSVIYGEFNNPNSQIVRTVYEFGLVGTFLIVFAFLKIIHRCTLSLQTQDARLIVYTMLIMLGATFAHRSNVYLIWMGLLVAVSAYLYRARTGHISASHLRRDVAAESESLVNRCLDAGARSEGCRDGHRGVIPPEISVS